MIGVGDTGVDIKSTFFYDAGNSVRYNTKKLDNNHRKIALYVPLSNSEDSVTDGHGTHVCATVLGKANVESASQYNVFIL